MITGNFFSVQCTIYSVQLNELYTVNCTLYTRFYLVMAAIQAFETQGKVFVR